MTNNSVLGNVDRILETVNIEIVRKVLNSCPFAMATYHERTLHEQTYFMDYVNGALRGMDYQGSQGLSNLLRAQANMRDPLSAVYFLAGAAATYIAFFNGFGGAQNLPKIGEREINEYLERTCGSLEGDITPKIGNTTEKFDPMKHDSRMYSAALSDAWPVIVPVRFSTLDLNDQRQVEALDGSYLVFRLMQTGFGFLGK